MAEWPTLLQSWHIMDVWVGCVSSLPDGLTSNMFNLSITPSNLSPMAANLRSGIDSTAATASLGVLGREPFSLQAWLYAWLKVWGFNAATVPLTELGQPKMNELMVSIWDMLILLHNFIMLSAYVSIVSVIWYWRSRISSKTLKVGGGCEVNLE